MLAETRIKEWRHYLERLSRGGDVSKARLAKREVLCWEYMARLESDVNELIQITKAGRNVPGELRYFVEKMARHVEGSAQLASAIERNFAKAEVANG